MTMCISKMLYMCADDPDKNYFYSYIKCRGMYDMFLTTMNFNLYFDYKLKDESDRQKWKMIIIKEYNKRIELAPSIFATKVWDVDLCYLDTKVFQITCDEYYFEYFSERNYDEVLCCKSNNDQDSDENENELYSDVSSNASYEPIRRSKVYSNVNSSNLNYNLFTSESNLYRKKPILGYTTESKLQYLPEYEMFMIDGLFFTLDKNNKIFLRPYSCTNNSFQRFVFVNVCKKIKELN